MEDTAILDIPEIDSPPFDPDPDPVSEPEPESESGDEPSAPPDPGTEPAEASALATDKPVFASPGKLSAEAKATLEEIKAKNPSFYRAVKEAIYGRAALEKAFPGGMKEVQALKSTIEQYGGTEALEKVKGNADRFQQLDDAYTNADPHFIDELIANEDGQTAFLKLAPIMFQKYAQMSPEGYGAQVAQVFVADMMQERVPLMLERLADFVGESPKALEVLNQLNAYVNRIYQASRKKVEIPDSKAAAPADDRAKSLDEREATLTRNEWRDAGNTDRMRFYNAAWKEQMAGRKVSPDQEGAIKELYASRMSKVVQSPDFIDKTGRYFAAKDKAGFLKHSSATFKSAIPDALKAAINAVLGPGKTAAKPNGTTPAVNGAPKPALGLNGVPKAPGFLWVGARPHPNDIHHSTTGAMIMEGKAVLRDGRRVQWKRGS